MEKKHQQEEYVDFVVTARKYKTLLTAKYKSRPMWHKPSAGDVVSRSSRNDYQDYGRRRTGCGGWATSANP